VLDRARALQLDLVVIEHQACGHGLQLGLVLASGSTRYSSSAGTPTVGQQIHRSAGSTPTSSAAIERKRCSSTWW
jgi:hypothetical protein